MRAPQWLTARLADWRFILWRRPNLLVAVLAVLGIYESLLPAFVSPNWQDKLQPFRWINSSFPHVEVWVWVLIAAAAAVFIVMENAHHANDDRALEWGSERNGLTASIGNLEQRIAELTAEVTQLRESMIPKLIVTVGQSHQVSPDRKWRTAILSIYNQGTEAARNCYGKLTSVHTIQIANAPDVVPASGRHFAWPTLVDNQACTIGAHSEQFLALAIWSVESTGAWYLYVQGNKQEFPLTAGVWQIGLEVGADNVLPAPFKCRLTFVPPDSCLIEPQD